MSNDNKAKDVHPYNGLYAAISIHKHVIFGKMTHDLGSRYYIVDDVLFVEERVLPGEEDKQNIVRQGPDQIVLERRHVTSIARSTKAYHKALIARITE